MNLHQPHRAHHGAAEKAQRPTIGSPPPSNQVDGRLPYARKTNVPRVHATRRSARRRHHPMFCTSTMRIPVSEDGSASTSSNAREDLPVCHSHKPRARAFDRSLPRALRPFRPPDPSVISPADRQQRIQEHRDLPPVLQRMHGSPSAAGAATVGCSDPRALHQKCRTSRSPESSGYG